MKLSVVSSKAQRYANTLEDFQYMLEGIIEGHPDDWQESPESYVWRELAALVEDSVIQLGKVAEIATLNHQP